jgi:hypothetical protein
MTAKQLSIFMENRSGTLINVLEVLKKAKIQILASTIADTAEYGIYRIICDQPKEAFAELQAAGVAVALSDVFALELDNVPGGAADVVRIISEAGISIAYLYSFTHKGKGILIFRTDNMDEAREVITKNNLKYICGKDISELF